MGGACCSSPSKEKDNETAISNSINDDKKENNDNLNKDNNKTNNDGIIDDENGKTHVQNGKKIGNAQNNDVNKTGDGNDENDKNDKNDENDAVLKIDILPKPSQSDDDDENKPLNSYNKQHKQSSSNNKTTKISIPIPTTPKSTTPKSPKKHLVGNESPPESENDDDGNNGNNGHNIKKSMAEVKNDDFVILEHPILNDLHASESTPINGNNKDNESMPNVDKITAPKNGKNDINIINKPEDVITPMSYTQSKSKELGLNINPHSPKVDINKKNNDTNTTNTGTAFKVMISTPEKRVTPFGKKKFSGTNLFGNTSLAHGNKQRNSMPPGIGHNNPLFQSNNSDSYSKSNSFIAIHPSAGSGLNELPQFNVARSHTLTLDSAHRDKLDKRRQSSLLVRRNKNNRNLPIKINKLWSVFAKYRIDQMLEERKLNDDENKKKKKEKKHKKEHKNKKIETIASDSNLMQIDETPEPSPEAAGNILDQIINSTESDKNNKRNKNKKEDGFYDEQDVLDDGNHIASHPSDVLDIDPRLFADAKSSSSIKRDSSSSSTSSGSSDSCDGGSSNSSDGGLDIDVYELELTYSQFNIVLNNNNIEVSPDMCAALIWLLLNTNKMISPQVFNLGNEQDNLHNNPMKERAFHNKQFKVIFKCKITYKMIESLMRRLNSNQVSRQDKSLHPKHLSYEKRNLVIWDKIIDHLINKTSFNVEEEYLYGALQEEDLRDGNKIIEMLSTLESHWQHRVQLMEYIDDKLSSGNDMEREIFFASILSENDNYLKLLNGWSVQLTDDRSGVARSGVTLLPAVLSSLLLCVTYPAVFFDAELINTIYSGIFTLVKNRRLKDMADDAYETLIQVTDILVGVAGDLEDYDLVQMIVSVLEDHSNPKIEKHEKARESCIGGMGFLLYGVEAPPEETINFDNNKKTSLNRPDNLLPKISHELVHTPLGAFSSDDIKTPDYSIVSDEEKTHKKEEKTAIKLSKIMQRDYLLSNEEFMKSFAAVLLCGVTDKTESCRRKTFKLIQKLENNKLSDGKERNIFTEFESKWDYTVTKKYNNYKKLQQRPKRGKKKKSSRRNKKNKKSTLKKRTLINKKSVNKPTTNNNNDDDKKEETSKENKKNDDDATNKTDEKQYAE